MADDAYTLADFQSRSEDTLVNAVIQTFREQAPVMERLKWKPSNGLDMKMLRTKALPTEAWIKLGEDIHAKKGKNKHEKTRIYTDIIEKTQIPHSVLTRVHHNKAQKTREQ